mgnify:CR=1 FL=1|jgi:hypothetical protein
MDNIFAYFNQHILKSFEFIKANFDSILIIVWILIIMMIYVTVFNLSFEKKENKKVTKITIENMSGYTSSNKEKAKQMCKSKDINKMCKEHSSKSTCNMLDCCVWAKNKKGTFCVEGSVRGPTINLAGQNRFEEYWYRKSNKKRL